jgi:hypothetical protein
MRIGRCPHDEGNLADAPTDVLKETCMHPEQRLSERKAPLSGGASWAAMRSRASLAIGAGPPWAISKKRRRRCAQQKASVIASSRAALAIVL